MSLQAVADTVYSNGPYNGTTDGWTINFGFSVSDSFTTPSGSGIEGLNIVYWDASSSDLLTTVDMALGSTSFSGTPQTLAGVTNTFLGVNQYGYNLFRADYSFAYIPWSAAGYMTLSNACSTSGCSVSNPIYWDENSGIGCYAPWGQCPSLAYSSQGGQIPSEAFTLTGDYYGGGTPEPSSILLFGSGVLGLVAVLRRKLGR
ncbi:MAG: PEP-CTERM sorting domain-containing protein [Candidatus Korobacteraceae bacterium]